MMINTIITNGKKYIADFFTSEKSKRIRTIRQEEAWMQPRRYAGYRIRYTRADGSMCMTNAPV